MNEITKNKENISKEQLKEKNITNIVSESDMKNMFFTIIEECNVNIEEAMDSYNIFKDMVMNGADFESSIGSKEQLAILLNTAQNASDSKIKMFTELLRAKTRKEVSDNKSNILQNNIILGDRRDLISAIEESREDTQEIIETSIIKKQIEEKIKSIDFQNNKDYFENNEKIKKEQVNKKEEVFNKKEEIEDHIDFEIKSGDF